MSDETTFKVFYGIKHSILFSFSADLFCCALSVYWVRLCPGVLVIGTQSCGYHPFLVTYHEPWSQFVGVFVESVDVVLTAWKVYITWLTRGYWTYIL